MQFLYLFWTVGVTELVVFASFFPPLQAPWRDWPDVRWLIEWPYMYPPLFASGLLWFALQFINGLSISWLSAAVDEQGPLYYACIWSWLTALGVWSLWGVPWQYRTVNWSLLVWTASLALSVTSCVCGWLMPERSPVGPVLLTVYCSLVGAIVLFNLSVLVYRTLSSTTYSAQRLHKHWPNVLSLWLQDGLWPPTPQPEPPQDHDYVV